MHGTVNTKQLAPSKIVAGYVHGYY